MRRSCALLALAIGCLDRPATPVADETPRRDAAAPDTREPLALLTWNLQWWQDPARAPDDDAAQYDAVVETLRARAPSLAALQEVSSEAGFERLLRDLPGYAGVLSGFDWPQRTALLFRREQLQLLRAQPLSGLADAGRPPLEVELVEAGGAGPLVVVVLHAKAQADAASHDARRRLAEGVAEHLRTAHPSTPRIVIGDFNDLLQGSILPGATSPYAAFTRDPQYLAVTLTLNTIDTGEPSHLLGSTIDHIVISRELAPRADDASVEVLRDELLPLYPAYRGTVSDHFPVTVMLKPGDGSGQTDPQ